MGDCIYKPIIEDMVWSYSRITSYENCPYGWKLHYINDVKSEDMFYSQYGSLMHELIAEYYKGNIDKEDLLVLFLIKSATELDGRKPKGSVAHSYFKNGRDYFRNFEPFDLEILEVEHKYEFIVGKYKFVGVIDLVLRDDDGGIIIVDHKSRDLKPRSSKGTLKRDQELDDYLRQLYMYSIPIKEIFGVYPKELWFNCFRTGTVIKEPFDESKVENVINWSNNLIEKIMEDTDFFDNEDYYFCRYLCDVHNNCNTYLEG